MPESERRRFGTRELADKQKQALQEGQDFRKLHEQALAQDQLVSQRQYEYFFLCSIVEADELHRERGKFSRGYGGERGLDPDLDAETVCCQLHLVSDDRHRQSCMVVMELTNNY